MAEFDEIDESTQLKPKKTSKIMKIFVWIIIILLAVICMIIISNMVFKSRSAEMFAFQSEVWKPGISSKTFPLSTFALDPIQMSLNDPTGGSTAFIKVVMALAFKDAHKVKSSGGGGHGGGGEELTPMEEELDKRKFQIRDTIIRLIGSKTFDDLNTPEKQIDFKQEVISAVNSMLINGLIQDIYFSEFNVMLANQ